MKTKLRKYSTRFLIIVMAVIMLISCALAGILTANAALSVAGKIYFIKPSDWTYAALMIGHSSHSNSYQMSNISGTDLYYVKIDSAWSDSTEFAFFDVNGWGGEGNSIGERSSYAEHTSTTNSTYAMNAGSTYLIPTTDNSPTYYSDGYSALNNTLTIKTMLYGSSSYAETSTKCGTFSATDAKEISGDGTSADSSVSQTNATGTLSVARTNTATISQTKATGYTFQGWKASKDTSGSGLTTGNYSFTNTGSAATIYAYYKVASTPAASAVSLSQSPANGSIYSGETQVTYTASATSPQSGVTYNFTVNGTTVQNTSSTTYTHTFSNEGTYTVNVTVEKSGYDSVTSSDKSTQVIARPSVYFKYSQTGGTTPKGLPGTQMTYDSSTGKYKLEVDLNSGSNNDNWYFIVIYDESENKNLSYNNGYLPETLHTSSSGFIIYDGDNNVNNPLHIIATVTGKYTFYFDADNNELYVDYPRTVTFNANGHGTAPSAQVVKYGGTATNPTAPTADGYDFGGWYANQACTGSQYNFSTAVTSDKTLYAKWTAQSKTLTVKSAVKSTSNGSYTDYSTFTSELKMDNVTTQSKSVAVGSTCTVKAVDHSSDGYVFMGWYNGDNRVSTNLQYTHTMGTTNTTLVARYDRKYTLTIQNKSGHNHGTIGSSSITVFYNDTPAQLTVTPEAGYQIDWSNSTNLSDYYTQPSSLTGTVDLTGLSASNITGTRKNTTISIAYSMLSYTITAGWAGNYATGTNGNSINITNTSGTTISSGNKNDTFEFRVTLADGYEMDGDPSFTTSSGYATPTIVSGYPTTSGNVVTYRYKLNAGNVGATFTLKAKTPTINKFKIQGEDGDDSFPYTDMLNNSTVNLFYKQPVKIDAEVDSFSKAGFEITKSGTTYASSSSNSNLNNSDLHEYGINMTREMTGADTVDGYVEYTITMTVTNQPQGIVAAATYSRQVTIKINYNSAQKVYKKIKNLYENTVAETPATAATYYESDAPYTRFNSKRNTVKDTYTTDGNWNKWPVYNLGSDNTTNIKDDYDDFFNVYQALQSKAKTTTIYILSRYQYDSSNFVSIYNNDTGVSSDDFAHFKQYHYYIDDVYISNTVYSKGENQFNNHCMKYEGKIADSQSSTKYYVYSFKYAGHCSVTIYHASTKNELYSLDKRLTGTYSSGNVVTTYGEYYRNLYATSYSSTSTTDFAAYNSLKNTKGFSGKARAEIDEECTASQIKDKLGLSTSGSLKTASDPTIGTTEEIFTIQSKPGSDQNPTDLTANNANWKPEKQGRYKVTYKTKINYFEAAQGNTVNFETTTDVFYIYVSYEEIKIYVDMNDNVGSPTINFKYYTDSNGDICQNNANATENILPFNMSLVSGSESIYSATVNLKKLQSDYGINYKNGNNFQNITINSISVDGREIGTTHTIYTNSYFTGSVWFKADSTSLKSFKNISDNTVVTSFRAVDENGNHLDEAISMVSGTGIITDVINQDSDNIYGIHQVSYAGQNSGSGDSAIHYSVRARAQEKYSVTEDDVTTNYYFDRWVKMKSPESISITKDNNSNKITVNPITLNGTTTVHSKADYSINKAPLTDDEDTETTNDGDYTYVAVYEKEPAANSTSPVRVKLNYKFRDYDTSDGNYIYDENKDTVPASYSKIVKLDNDVTYSSATSNISTIAENNMPVIKSNYFDYSYVATITVNNEQVSATTINTSKSNETNYIEADVQLTESARQYKIKVVDSNNNQLGDVHQGYYQQTVELNAGNIQNAAWKVKTAGEFKVVGTGSTYTARYVLPNDDDSNCQIIKVVSEQGASVSNKSIITNSFSEVYQDGATEKVKHNFYIVDYCEKGKLIGGGVIFATAENGNFRQTNAATAFADPSTYINGILENDYTTEYKTQTINNVGFRYLPYEGSEDVYRYSDVLNAYQYIYTGTNTNSMSYSGQTLRVKSFMVYNSGTAQNPTYSLVPSDGYAEVSRCISPTS